MTTYPHGYQGMPQGMGTMLTFDQLMVRPTIAKLDPEFRRRTFAMMEEAAHLGVPLGVGTGHRSHAAQAAGYARNPGGFARPYNSNHESFDPGDSNAVAADMVPNVSWAWMQAHCARFGLRTFAVGVRPREAWHLQPSDIPAGRNKRKARWHLPAWPLPGSPPDVEVGGAWPPVDFVNGVFGLWPLAPGKRWLWEGGGGDDVRYLQSVIYHRAGGSISIDGDFGRQTTKRVKDLQAFFGLTVDGRVGPQSWRVIDMLALG